MIKHNLKLILKVDEIRVGVTTKEQIVFAKHSVTWTVCEYI